MAGGNTYDVARKFKLAVFRKATSVQVTGKCLTFFDALSRIGDQATDLVVEAEA